MRRRVFQLRDKDGGPQGGHVFEAPDEASLVRSIQEVLCLPEGWTREEVGHEGEIVHGPRKDPPVKGK